MQMRFTIEQRHLTDGDGKPIANDPGSVSFHLCEAETVDDAVRLFVSGGKGELIGDVLKFPGAQAVATLRTTMGVYTIQVTPASQQHFVV
jgi:hypothetical protein